jgi:hypothetical protein
MGEAEGEGELGSALLGKDILAGDEFLKMGAGPDGKYRQD